MVALSSIEAGVFSGYCMKRGSQASVKETKHRNLVGKSEDGSLIKEFEASHGTASALALASQDASMPRSRA